MKKLILLLVSLMIISCSSDNPVGLGETPPVSKMPVVSGIYILYENGCTAGKIGNPTSYVGIDDFYVMHPIPNPFKNKLIIHFFNRKDEELAIWIIPATVSRSLQSDEIIFGNSFFYNKNRKNTLLTKELFKSGVHDLYLNTGKDGLDLLDGYYRIYFQTKTGLAWFDLLKSEEKK